jgi:hypothetical protein
MEFKMSINAMTDRWSYLNDKDSELYDKVKDSDSPHDKVVKELLERLAKASWAEHCRSRY